jgi:hypothetical protein
MEAFFSELDELRTAYMRRHLDEEAWVALLDDLLRSIDVQLPLYERVAGAGQAALVRKMRSDIAREASGGVFPDLREAVIDAAVLEKALTEASALPHH